MISQSVGRGVVQIESELGSVRSYSSSSSSSSGGGDSPRGCGHHRSSCSHMVWAAAAHLGAVQVTVEIPASGKNLATGVTSVGTLVHMAVVVKRHGVAEYFVALWTWVQLGLVLW